MTHKLLIPVDDSEIAQRAIDFAVQQQRNGNPPEVVLINVRRDPEYQGEISPQDYEVLERTKRDVQQRVLAKSLAYAERIGLKNVAAAAAQGSPGDEIVRAAKQRGVDHILMGTHGRSTMGGLLLGSVAHRVVHLAPMPVTLVK
jgi:nucleotide-binding universal stress UspA family protein